MYLEKNITFSSFINNDLTVYSNLKDNRLDIIQKSLAIDKVVNYVTENIGRYPHENITVSQVDYERNPFYGLNQLPSFISPFEDSFLFELKFLKTYLNNYLKNTLKIEVWLVLINQFLQTAPLKLLLLMPTITIVI